MKTVCAAAFTALLIASPPAQAMTCDEFVDAVEASKMADLLPELDVRQIADMPQGMMEVVNLRNIENGLMCRDGTFGSFGATLYESAEPDRLRFAALVSALLEAIAPDEPGREKLAADLQAEALEDAAKAEIRTGNFSGTAEASLGDYAVAFGAMKGMIDVRISSR